jgi:DNA (cytosine-5)-methyltransferase 1
MRVRRMPDKSEILAARKAAGLSAREAAELLHTTTRVWQQWEYGERRMHAAFWELFQLKTAAAGTARPTPSDSATAFGAAAPAPPGAVDRR